jgi:PAS domain S-box-containing protein
MTGPQRRPLVAGLITLAGALAAAALGGWWQARVLDEEARLRFDAVSERAVVEIDQRMQVYARGLNAMRGLVLAAGGPQVRREAVRTYMRTRDLDTEFPGARGFGVIWRVPAEREQAFVEAARRDGFPDFAIRQLSPHGGERKVITFIEPVERNRAAVGLDVASEANRNRAAQESARTGRAALTGPITLVQATGQELRSFLLMLPIYRDGSAPGSQAEREAATIGWAYAPLVTDEVLGGLRGAGRDFEITLRDRTESTPQRFFGPEADAPPGRPVSRTALTVHGRRWEAELRATPEFMAALDTHRPGRVAAVIAGMGGLLSLVVYLVVQGMARSRLERLEQARRAAIVEGSEDAIIGATLDGVVTEWNGGAERLFGVAAADALGRPMGPLLLPADRLDEDDRLRWAIARGERVPPFETTRRHRDGTLIAVSLTAAPIIDGQGRCVGMSKTLRDTRQAQRAKQALADLNAQLEQQVLDRTERLDTALHDLRAILDAVPSMIGYWDAKLVNRVANRAYGTWFGLDPARLRGRRLPEVLGAFWELQRPRVEAALAGEKQVFERSVPRQDGGTRHVLIHYLPDVTPDGVRGFYVMVHDITPMKELQQAGDRARGEAEAATRFLQAVTDGLPVRIAYHDHARRYRFANAAQCAALGLPRERIVGRIDGEDGVPALSPAMEAHVDEVLGGRQCTFEAEEMAGHAPVDVEMRLVPDLAEDGRVVGWFSVGTDITVRKRAERELRRALATLNSVLDAATQVAITATDAEGRVVLFNRGAERLLGYRADEVVGRMRGIEFHDADEVAARAAALEGEVGRPFDARACFIDPSVLGRVQEWHYLGRDGQRIPVSLAVTDMRDDAGELVGYLGIAHDVTARQQYEFSLREAMHRANHANRAKSQFLANMSHEIRTPMNAVIGLSYLLERTALDTDQAGFVAKIKLAGKSLLSIINDVLDLSKIEAAEMRIEQAPFSPAALLEELADLMKVQADAKGICFSADLQCALPPALQGDATRLRQVLTNLLSNAIKFTERGKVSLGVRASTESSGRLRLCCTVQDTGIGIAPDALERVFQPFAQADASTTRRYGGTGLGLSIVRQLVELMGGSIDVRSTPGVGSEFAVDIPFEVCEADVTLPEVQRPAEDAGPALPGVRVLVVDDSSINLEVARRILELEGATVSLAADGQQAVDTLLHDPDAVDVVLMDVQMPVLDGHDATRRIRSGLGLRHLPVIALTAGVTTGEQARAQAAGMNDVLGKPFDPRALVACLLRHVTPREPLAATAQRHRPEATPWPTVDGIDGADVRTRLGNDVTLFRSMLRRLLRDFDDLDSDPPARRDLHRMAGRMHNLKGSAGTLGAKAVERLAAQAESACIAGDMARVGPLLQRLAGEIERLSLSAAPALADESVPEADDAVPDAPLDVHRLGQMVAALQASDLGAIEHFESLAPGLRSRLGRARTAALRELVDNLQFAEVAAALEPLCTAAAT